MSEETTLITKKHEKCANCGIELGDTYYTYDERFWKSRADDESGKYAFCSPVCTGTPVDCPQESNYAIKKQHGCYCLLAYYSGEPDSPFAKPRFFDTFDEANSKMEMEYEGLMIDDEDELVVESKRIAAGEAKIVTEDWFAEWRIFTL